MKLAAESRLKLKIDLSSPLAAVLAPSPANFETTLDYLDLVIW